MMSARPLKSLRIVLCLVLAVSLVPLTRPAYAASLEVTGIPEELNVTAYPQPYRIDVQDVGGNEPARVQIRISGSGVSSTINKTIYTDWNLVTLQPQCGGVMAFEVTAWDTAGQLIGTYSKLVPVDGYVAGASPRQFEVGETKTVRVTVSSTQGAIVTSGLQLAITSSPYSNTVKTADDGEFVFSDIHVDQPTTMDLIVKDTRGNYKAYLPNFITVTAANTYKAEFEPASVLAGKDELMRLRFRDAERKLLTRFSGSSVVVGKQSLVARDFDGDGYSDGFVFDTSRNEDGTGLMAKLITDGAVTAWQGSIPVVYPAAKVSSPITAGYRSPVSIILTDPRNGSPLEFSLLDVVDNDGHSLVTGPIVAGIDSAHATLLLRYPEKRQGSLDAHLIVKLDREVSIPISLPVNYAELQAVQSQTRIGADRRVELSLSAAGKGLSGRQVAVLSSGTNIALGLTDDSGRLEEAVSGPFSDQEPAFFTIDDLGNRLGASHVTLQDAPPHIEIGTELDITGRTVKISIRATSSHALVRLTLNGESLPTDGSNELCWEGTLPLDASEKTFAVSVMDTTGAETTASNTIAPPPSGPRKSVLTVDSRTAVIDGKTTLLDASPFIDMRGQLNVPLYSVAPLLGLTLHVDVDHSVIYLYDDRSRLSVDLTARLVMLNGRSTWPMVGVAVEDGMPLVQLTTLAEVVGARLTRLHDGVWQIVR